MRSEEGVCWLTSSTLRVEECTRILAVAVVVLAHAVDVVGSVCAILIVTACAPEAAAGFTEAVAVVVENIAERPVPTAIKRTKIVA